MADVFISYAHIDNEPFGPHQRHWVSDLSANLSTKLAQLLGRRVNVWRDPRLGGSAVIKEEIQRQIKDAPVMLSVVSPRYVVSDSCRNEVGWFEESHSVRVDTRKRIVKVVKTPVPLDEQPEIFHDLIGYEFFRLHPETGRPKDYDADIREYWDILNDVSYEVRSLLALVAGQAPRAQATVYVAETTSDLVEERRQLCRDLKDRGYFVLPESPLPMESSLFRAAVETAVSRSKVSVHLVGSRYGAIPEGETSSIVDLQCEIASRLAAGPVPRIVWMPPGLQPSDPRTTDLITRLEASLGGRNGCEIVKTRLEELKAFIHDKLSAPAKPATDAAAYEGPPHLYLMCEARDRQDAKPVRDCFFEHGFEVTLPLESGSPAEVREDHEENLRLCDAAVIYWGQAEEAWPRAKLRDLLKAPGLGRAKPAPPGGFYLASPETAAKTEFRSQYLTVTNYGPFHPGTLTPFLDHIAQRKASAQ